MAMNFGTALEALKSGETISRGSGHVAYRRSGAHVMRLKDEDGVIVSTVAQAFGMAEVLSEDWLITGYAQKGIENAGTQEELALGDSGEPAPEEVRDVFVEGAHIGVGAGSTR